MMKKKNVAMAMAATMMASAVAPVVANAAGTVENYDITKEQQSKLISQVRSLLEKKYTDTDESVYTITATYKDTINGSDVSPVNITKASQLADILESKFDVKVTIIDNGHVVVGDKIEDSEVKKYTENDIYELGKNFRTTFLSVIDEVTTEYDVKNNALKINIYKEKEGVVEVGKTFNIAAGSDELKVSSNDLVLKVTSGKTTTEKTTSEIKKAINAKTTSIATAMDKAYDVTTSDTLQGTTISTLREAVESIKNETSEVLAVESLPDVTFKSDLMTQAKVMNHKKQFQDMLTNAENLVNNVDVTSTSSVLEAQEAVKSLSTMLDGTGSNDADNEEAKLALGILYYQYEFNKIKGLVTTTTKTPIDSKTYVVKVSDKEVELFESEDLFDGLMLSEKGEEILDALVNGVKDGSVEYKVAMQDGKINKLENGKYELVMTFTATEQATAKAAGDVKNFEIKVTDEDRTTLEKILSIYTNKSVDANKIVGEDRYKTAVKISQDTAQPSQKNGAVVLVGGEALVDGLAATPFAKAIDAPILLTEKDSLNADTEKEIKRLLVDDTTVSNLKTQTVYIVGGEAVISNEVVEALEAMGITVERLAGVDRETTSLAVAEKMNKLNKIHADKTFVVGGNGEADAMSIAAHAAKEKAPIIVTTGYSNLSKDTKKFLDGRNIDIIGGTSVVNEEIEAELKALDKDEKIVRTKGDTRFETNANVIKNYYKSGVKTVYVAKDGYVEGNDKLVDALSISKVAAEDGVIVLATDDLTVEQTDALEVRTGTATHLTQVGGGVSETVVNKLAKMLGFIK